MKSLHKHSLIALAVLCVALWGCASTDDGAVATNDTTTVSTVNPDGGYPTSISAEATTAGSGENLAANAAVKEPIVDTTPAMIVRTTNSTVVSGTSGTSSAVAVDNTATLSTGTTGVSGSLLDTTPTTVTAVTVPVSEPVQSQTMTSSSTLNDQEDTTAKTTTSTTTRTRLRKD